MLGEIALHQREGLLAAQEVSRLQDERRRMAESEADMAQAQDQLLNVLTHTHRGIQDIRLETREDLLQSFERQRDSYMVSLGGVALIGLIVGVVAIVSIVVFAPWAYRNLVEFGNPLPGPAVEAVLATPLGSVTLASP